MNKKTEKIDWDWSGDIVSILANGPSLCLEDIEYIKGRTRVIAVNDTYRICPWADILYASDRNWWEYYNYVQDFRGQRWTVNRPAKWGEECRNYGIHVVDFCMGLEVSTDRSYIVGGYNSSFQALNIATLSGAKLILFLGLDCTTLGNNNHWFGNHPPMLRNKSNYALFIKAFNSTAPLIKKMGIRVVNCSPITAVRCFDVCDSIRDVL